MFKIPLVVGFGKIESKSLSSLKLSIDNVEFLILISHKPLPNVAATNLSFV